MKQQRSDKCCREIPQNSYYIPRHSKVTWISSIPKIDKYDRSSLVHIYTHSLLYSVLALVHGEFLCSACNAVQLTDARRFLVRLTER